MSDPKPATVLQQQQQEGAGVTEGAAGGAVFGDGESLVSTEGSPAPAVSVRSVALGQLDPPVPHPREEGDCLGCRLTGLMMGLGGCGYLSSRLFTPPPPTPGHRLAIMAGSVTMLVMGVGRAIGL